MKLLISFIVLVSSLSLADTVDTKSFVQSMAGKYTILFAGWALPHPSPSGGPAMAVVRANPDSAVIGMPYCPSETVCEPGTVIFNYADAQVTKVTLESGHDFYLLTVNGNRGVAKYGWEQSSCSVTFTNFQHSVAGAQVETLQHILKKVVADCDCGE